MVSVRRTPTVWPLRSQMWKNLLSSYLRRNLKKLFMKALWVLLIDWFFHLLINLFILLSFIQSLNRSLVLSFLPSFTRSLTTHTLINLCIRLLIIWSACLSLCTRVRLSVYACMCECVCMHSCVCVCVCVCVCDVGCICCCTALASFFFFFTARRALELWYILKVRA